VQYEENGGVNQQNNYMERIVKAIVVLIAFAGIHFACDSIASGIRPKLAADACDAGPDDPDADPSGDPSGADPEY
jgi:hypothetical protein